MKPIGELYRLNLTLAAAIRLGMYLQDRAVYYTWPQINKLPKMTGRIIKNPAERN